MQSLTLVTAAADEGPVDLDRFKAQARIDSTTEDALLTAYLKAATQYLDGLGGILGRALMTQTWELALDRWPGIGRDGWRTIELPLPPLQSVTSVKYTDTNGTQQTLATDQYQVDTRPTLGRIVPAYNISWPSLQGGSTVNQVVVRFVAGYGATPESVPEPIRLAITLLASHWYERRVAFETIGPLTEVPLAFHALTAVHKVNQLGWRRAEDDRWTWG